MTTTSSVDCMHCGRTIGNLAGLSAHMRAMHPDKVGNQPATNGTAPPPEPAANGIVWEDPPQNGTGRTGIVTIIAPLIPELRRNPGKWARLHTWPRKGSASAAKNAIKKKGNYPDIEFLGRSTPDGTSALYGRYVEAE